MYIDRLETEDLVIAKAKMEDLDGIYQNFWSESESAKYMLWRPLTSINQAHAKLEKFITNQQDTLSYFIYLKKSNQPIGVVRFIKVEEGVYEDAGIGLGTKFVRCGYGTQALSALMNYIFESLGANKILLSSFKENEAGRRLIRKVGGQYLFTIADVREYDNLEYAVEYYQVLNANK